jgi:LysM repeat protein
MPENLRSRAIVVGAALTLLVGLFSVDYTVERGDTLGKIARDHDVSVADLVDANNLPNPHLIRIGQVLVIPGEEGEPEVVHVVVRGDTLGKIASKYGSTVSALVEVNQIANPNVIRIGQNIVVSGGSSSTGSSGSSTGSSNEPTGNHAHARSGKFHIVKRGESLDSIAAQYNGVSANQIAAANGILNGVVYTNTRLFLDGPTFIAEGSPGEGVYVIKKGDRLGDIAASHGTTISALAESNNIANVNLIRAGQQLVVPSGSSWVCPVGDARFFNDWGFPRARGTRYHEGNDLFAPLNTKIRAPVSGIVEVVTGTIGGKQFNLIGDDGIKYLGSHMNEFGKSGRVKAGDVIGYVGTTGNASGTSPHLHFGMYLKDGTVVNPYPSLITNGCK